MSRTLQGHLSCETSELKELPQGLSAQEVSTIALRNVEEVLNNLLKDKPAPRTAEEAQSFIIKMYRDLNRDLIEPNSTAATQIWRQWNTGIATHPAPDQIAQQMQEKFYPRLITALANPRFDAAETAAWVEKTFNAEIHPLYDGCGRTAKVLAAYFLISAGLPYPKFQSRQEFFEKMNQPLADWASFYQSRLR